MVKIDTSNLFFRFLAKMEQFDVVVIGGGPGGYVAAIRAAQLGMKTALVEKQHLGGVCLNWGCIPTKALLKSAEVMRTVKSAASYGIEVGNVSFDLGKMVARSRAISSQLTSGIQHLLKKNKVTVFSGHARLTKTKIISIEGTDKKTHEIKGTHTLLATGARSRSLPHLQADGGLIWTAKEAMIPDVMPKKLLVIGSGAIGIEFANFYNALGSEVTVVEIQNQILPVEDKEISTLAKKSFEKQGISFLLESSVETLEKRDTSVLAHIKTPKGLQTLEVDRVILAIGIIGNTEDLGLENTKVKVEKGQIVTNEWCETDEVGVYAIGDVASPPCLAHKASHEGILCIEKIKGLPHLHPLRRENIPGCTYSHPQIASIGLTQEKAENTAKDKGFEIKIGKFPFNANGKALALGETEGLIKVIFRKDTGELLGAHMIGAEVTELIQGFGIAKTLETTEEDLAHVVFPHPTLSEMMHEAILDADKRAIHF